MINRLFLFVIFACFLSPLLAQVQKPDYILSTGFFTVNGKIYNPDGTEFIMRGLNQNHFWGTESFNLNSIDGIAKTPANCVRVVMSDQDWVSQSNSPAKKRMLVERYIAKGIVPMVELHDGTCENSPTFIENIVESWILPENVAWFNEFEEYVILNIANEWGPGDIDADWRVWRDTYKQAITDLRDAGINNMIVLDSPKCGQGPRAMEVYGQELLDHDPQHNVVFSIHMYGWWRSQTRGAADVTTPSSNNPPWLAEWELQAMLDLSLPVIVGEFSWTDASSVGYDTKDVIKFCQEKGIGWLAWSWNGNSDPVLDMNYGWDYKSDADLRPFGKLIVDHPFYGFRATAIKSTVFGAPNQHPTCALVSPAAGDNLQVGANVRIRANASDSDGSIVKVEFYVGDEKLGAHIAAPYEVTWNNVPRGRHSLYAVAMDDSGSITASPRVEVKIGFREITKNALFVVSDTTLRPGDAVVKERLEMLGYNVEVLADENSASEAANGKDMVLISSSVAPTRVGKVFAEVPIPVVVWETQLFDDMRMTGSAINTDYGRADITSFTIVDTQHPMAAGRQGDVEILREAGRAAWGVPAAGAQIIATLIDNASWATLFVFEKGAAMTTGVAPAPRVGLFIQDDSAEQLTIAGWTLLDAAIDYAQTSAVKVQQTGSAMPVDWELKQNYPNPFNPQTRIDYALPQPAWVSIDVYNLAGQLVKNLVAESKSAGFYSTVWQGDNDKGELPANGIYYCRMVVQAGDKEDVRTRKMMLLK